MPDPIRSLRLSRAGRRRDLGARGPPVPGGRYRAAHVSSSESGVLILVADDSITTLTMVSARLQRTGYEVVTATRGDEALALALERRPQLVVLDVEMPGLNGIAVTEKLRDDESFANVPIVLLTAHADQAHVDAGKKAGANAYVVKPFSPQDLATTNRRVARPSLATNDAAELVDGRHACGRLVEAVVPQGAQAGARGGIGDERVGRPLRHERGDLGVHEHQLVDRPYVRGTPWSTPSSRSAGTR